MHHTNEIPVMARAQKGHVFLHVCQRASRAHLEARQMTGIQQRLLLVNAIAQSRHRIQQQAEKRVTEQVCSCLDGTECGKTELAQSLRAVVVEQHILHGVIQHAHCDVACTKQWIESVGHVGIVLGNGVLLVVVQRLELVICVLWTGT